MAEFLHMKSFPRLPHIYIYIITQIVSILFLHEIWKLCFSPISKKSSWASSFITDYMRYKAVLKTATVPDATDGWRYGVE